MKNQKFRYEERKSEKYQKKTHGKKIHKFRKSQKKIP
jgi:hypothetical protein